VVDFDRRADFFCYWVERGLHAFRQHRQQRVLLALHHRRRRQRVVWIANKFFQFYIYFPRGGAPVFIHLQGACR